MLTERDLEQRRDAGAAFLDTVAPGWYRRMDVVRLDVSCCDDCPLAQLCGEFRKGVAAFGLCQVEQIQYGFLLEYNYQHDDWLWHTLTTCWVELILGRLEADRNNVQVRLPTVAPGEKQLSPTLAQ